MDKVNTMYVVPFHSSVRMDKNGNPVTTLEIPMQLVNPESVDQLVKLVTEKFGVEEFAVEGVLAEIERLAVLSVLSKSMIPYRGLSSSLDSED